MDPLINPLDIRKRMGLDVDLKIDEFLYSAIEASQQHIASAVDTLFDRKLGKTDMFHLDPNAHAGIQRGGMFRLRLSRGFVTGTPSVTTQSDRRDTTGSNAPMDPDWYTWGDDGMETGLLQVEASVTKGQWVKVTYDSGFENPIVPELLAGVHVTLVAGGSGYVTPPLLIYAGGTGTGGAATATLLADVVNSITVTNYGNYTVAPSVVVEDSPTLNNATVAVTLVPATVPAHHTFNYAAIGAPDWLRECILAYCPVVFNFGPSTNRENEAEKNYKASGDHAESVASTHRRSKILVLHPL